MATLTVIPATPIAGKQCRITATAAATDATHVRLWCVDAPIGTKLRSELEKSGASRIVFHASVETGKSFDFTPEKGGVYVLEVDELQLAAGFSGDYEGDPRSAPPGNPLRATGDAQIEVAKPITIELGFGGDTATVLLHTFGQFIIPTSINIHGIRSPAVTNTKSPRAKAATETPEVRAAILALAAPASPADPGAVSAAVVGFNSSSLTGTIKRLADRFDKHLISNIHATTDGDNVTPQYLDDPESVAAQSEILSKVLPALGRHIRNANPAAESHPGETNSADPVYHEAISWSALPMPGLQPGGTAASNWVCCAEALRSYNAHVSEDSGAHTGGGTPIAASSPMMDLHVKFLTELAAIDPTTPATEHVATTLLLANGGKATD